MLSTLILVTLVTVAWSLWIRRVTWTCRLEVAATLNIALQGAALFLMSPYATHSVGEWLYDLTGQRNLEDWIGHDCYVVAASSIVYNAVGRLDDDAKARFKSEVEVPATLCIPALFVAFTASVAADAYRPDFFRIPTDVWLTVYWWILCGMLAYLLAYGWQALIPLRRDPESRRVATVYMAASAAGILACTVRIVTAALPATTQDTFTASFVVWVLACACGGGYAAMSAVAWKNWVGEPISAGGTRRG